MIAARHFLVAGAVLAQRRTAELADPHHQRRIEQAAAFEILQQRRDRLIGHQRIVGQLGVEVAVMVPGSVIEVDEAHAALDKPPSQQTVGGEGLELHRVRRRAPP